jgi:hypothetical protein
MRRRPKILIFVASLLIFFIPLFFALFQCYCLSDGDFFASPGFEGDDLLSLPSCSLGNVKFLVFSGYYHFLFLLDNNIFEQLHPILFQISSLDPTSRILRC